MFVEVMMFTSAVEKQAAHWAPATERLNYPVTKNFNFWGL